jgi:ribonuclease BN (tRNA processing enzyme)
VLPRLRRLEGWPRLDAIVITHFHLDHWGDLVPWAFGGLFGAGHEVNPPELWLPRGGRETLHGLDPVLYANAILELFEVHEYEERTPFTAAGFELVAYRMLHYALESYGLRVSDGDRTLAYSADSAKRLSPSPNRASAATSRPARRSTPTSRPAPTGLSSSTGPTSSRSRTESSAPTTGSN